MLVQQTNLLLVCSSSNLCCCHWVVAQSCCGSISFFLRHSELGNCLPPVNFKKTCSTDSCCLLVFLMLQFTHDNHQQQLLQCVLLLSISNVWLLGQLSSIAVKQWTTVVVVVVVFWLCAKLLKKTWWWCCLIIQWMLLGTSKCMGHADARHTNTP